MTSVSHWPGPIASQDRWNSLAYSTLPYTHGQGGAKRSFVESTKRENDSKMSMDMLTKALSYILPTRKGLCDLRTSITKHSYRNLSLPAVSRPTWETPCGRIRGREQFLINHLLRCCHQRRATSSKIEKLGLDKSCKNSYADLFV